MLALLIFFSPLDRLASIFQVVLRAVSRREHKQIDDVFKRLGGGKEGGEGERVEQSSVQKVARYLTCKGEGEGVMRA